MNRRMLSLAVVFLLLAGAASGCSDGGTSDGQGATTSATSSPDAGPDTTSAGSTTTGVPSTTEAPATAVLPRLDGGEAVPRIETATPGSGGGPRPELSWEPVDGADLYLVTLFAPNGEAYWAWQGAETSVPVGGRPRLVPEAAGPSVVDGMTWSVLAVGPDGALLGSSGPVDIAP